MSFTWVRKLPAHILVGLHKWCANDGYAEQPLRPHELDGLGVELDLEVVRRGHTSHVKRTGWAGWWTAMDNKTQPIDLIRAELKRRDE